MVGCILTGGRVTFVAVTRIEPEEFDTLAHQLSQHFVTYYGAPDIEAAMPVAQEELAQMISICDEHDANSLLTVQRELTEAGVRETYRLIETQAAGLDQFAIHAHPEG